MSSSSRSASPRQASSDEEERSKTPRGRGRSRLSTPLRKQRKKERDRIFTSERANCRLDKATHAKLKLFKETQKLNTFDQAILQLLKFFPSTATRVTLPTQTQRVLKNQTPLSKAAMPSSEESSSDESNPNLLKMVIVSRLITECFVSSVKIPVVLGLASMYFFGKIKIEEVISETQANRYLKSLFSYDAAILRLEFRNVTAVHLQADLSERKGEERLVLFLTFSKQAQGKPEPERKLVFSGAVASKAATEQLRVVVSTLNRLGVTEKLASVTSDSGADVVGIKGGLIALLETTLKISLLKIDCDLHIQNRALVVACETVFGPAVANQPSVLQLIYLIAYSVRSNWKKWKTLLEKHMSDEEKKKLFQPDIPLSTRWGTIFNAGEFAYESRKALRSLAKQVYMFFPSQQKLVRQTWKMIDVWLASPLLLLQLSMLIEFGGFYYTPEKDWSTHSQFRAADMPLRWLNRLQALRQAKSNPMIFFPKTFEHFEEPEFKTSDAIVPRIKAELNLFLETFINHVEPVAKKWLSFPLIACGIGDPNHFISKEIVAAICAARAPAATANSELDSKNQFSKNLPAGCLAITKHKLFDDLDLNTSMQASLSGPLSHTRCSLLRAWLHDYVYCVSTQQLYLEGKYLKQFRMAETVRFSYVIILYIITGIFI
jgi:hypothetical protein